MGNNNYLSLGNRDYQFAKRKRESEFNNYTVYHCEQACEKLLKSVVISKFAGIVDKIRTNNLSKLYSMVSDEIKLDRSVELYLHKLKDYYTYTMYPGDDYIDVTDEEVKEAIEVIDVVHDVVNEWHSNRVKPNVDFMIEAMKSSAGIDNKESSTVSLSDALDNLTKINKNKGE